VRNLQLSHIVDLVLHETAEPEKRLEKLFDWYVQRWLEIAKWLLGIAATITAALIVALVTKPDVISRVTIGFTLFSAIVSALAGFGAILVAYHANTHFVVSLSLLGRLQKVKPFLIKYRQSIDA
jgi:hypothetical protein